MDARGGIDRRICRSTSQRIWTVTGPLHRVVNRPSLTDATSLPANPRSSARSRPPLAKGWNRPPFQLVPLGARVGDRPINDALHGVATRQQMYQGGFDRATASPMAPGGAHASPKTTRRVGYTERR